MKTLWQTNPPHAPEAVDLALSQIAEFLKASGKERLTDLAAKADGYAQLIWILEKLSKASLDWRDQSDSTAPTHAQPGMSPESEKQLDLKLIGDGAT